MDLRQSLPPNHLSFMGAAYADADADAAGGVVVGGGEDGGGGSHSKKRKKEAEKTKHAAAAAAAADEDEDPLQSGRAFFTSKCKKLLLAIQANINLDAACDLQGIATICHHHYCHCYNYH